jgi:biotin synthase
MVYKVIALARLLCPDANIPATTALAALNRAQGYELGFLRGANVVMPNLTPFEYRKKYDIYPQKIRFSENPLDILSIHDRIRAIGRTIGKGPGERIRRDAAPPSPRDLFLTIQVENR